jgi:hypothetical protein
MDADLRELLPTPPLRARRRPDDWRKCKRKRKRHGYDYDVLIFHVIYFPFIVLAFRDLSSLPPSFRTHGLRRAKENSFLAFHRGTEENSVRGYVESWLRRVEGVKALLPSPRLRRPGNR